MLKPSRQLFTIICIVAIFIITTHTSQGITENFTQRTFGTYAKPLDALKPTIIPININGYTRSTNVDTIIFSNSFNAPAIVNNIPGRSCFGSGQETLEPETKSNLTIKIHRGIPDNQGIFANLQYEPFRLFEDNGKKIVLDKNYQSYGYSSNYTLIKAGGIFDSTETKEYAQQEMAKNPKKFAKKNFPDSRMSFVKTSYHVAELAFKSPDSKEIKHVYYVHAGNVFIELEYEIHGNQKRIPVVNVPAVIEDILSKLTADDLGGIVEVYPFPYNEPLDVGLIPASDGLPAKIIYRYGKPNTPISFTVLNTDIGELTTIEEFKTHFYTVYKTTTDGSGNAEVYFIYKEPQEKISKPQKATIEITCDTDTQKAHVVIGLGLDFDKIETVKASTEGTDSEKTFGILTTFKSKFYPKLNVTNYLNAASSLKIWDNGVQNLQRLGIQLNPNWINYPADAPEDNIYRGKLLLNPNTGMGIALDEPNFVSPKGQRIPTIVMGSNGEHFYQFFASPILLTFEKTSPEQTNTIDKRTSEPSFETNFPAVISSEKPASYFSMAACSLEPTTKTQFAVLTGIKYIPAYGKTADGIVNIISTICGFTKEEYASSMAKLALNMGGDFIDGYCKPDVFTKLSDQAKVAVIYSKMNYEAANFVVKAAEFDNLTMQEKLNQLSPEMRKKYLLNGLTTPTTNTKTSYVSNQDYSDLLNGTPARIKLQARQQKLSPSGNPNTGFIYYPTSNIAPQGSLPTNSSTNTPPNNYNNTDPNVEGVLNNVQGLLQNILGH